MYEWRKRFTAEAAFRRRKAREHSHDDRNILAAEMLDQLARSLPRVPPDVVAAADRRSARDPDAARDLIRQVGFKYRPLSAERFLRDLVAGGPVQTTQE